MSGRLPDDTVTAAMPERPRCDTGEGLCDDQGEDAQCPEQSRFRIERSDHDPSYMPGEACEIHVADTMAALLDGDDKCQLVVTMHWDWNDDPLPDHTERPVSRMGLIHRALNGDDEAMMQLLSTLAHDGALPARNAHA